MSTQDKGYYGEPPQYPQQAMPAYGQAPYGQAAAPYGQAASPAPYGQAASYQGGYPPPQQQPYGAPQPAYGAQPVYITSPAPAPPPQNNSNKDDLCFGCRKVGMEVMKTMLSVQFSSAQLSDNTAAWKRKEKANGIDEPWAVVQNMG
ncbi:hypothetical protein BGX34_008554 [Mortierella sp. NVP85]|nr:hypothetical protein BGX34_008554 [Mortierella sp. NVP85]